MGLAIAPAAGPLPDVIERVNRVALREDLLQLCLGVGICTMAIAALTVHFLRSRRSGRLLLWFGLFAGLYGARLVVRLPTVLAAFAAPPWFHPHADAWITYVIIVPALLFFEELYGRGWRGLVRWYVVAQAAYSGAAILVGIGMGDPFWAPDPASSLAIFLVPILVADRILGYRPPPIEDRRLLAGGTFVFVGAVVNEHLVNNGWAAWNLRVEPVGFFIFVAVMGYVALRRFVANEQQLRTVDEEMKAASRIQASILPRRTPTVKGLSVAVRYIPMTAVAGDFYDFLPVDENKLGVLVADVTGHGVPAALVASMVKVAFTSLTDWAHEPARVIGGLNRTMCDQSHGQYATASYLFLDRGAQRAYYAAAAHPPMFLHRPGADDIRSVTENGLLLGFQKGEEYSSMEIDLEPGDRLVQYTDGIIEAASPSGEFWGDERLRLFVREHRDLSADQFAEALVRKLEDWRGPSRRRQQTDDLTLVVVDVLPS